MRLQIFCLWCAAESPGCFSHGLLWGSRQWDLSRKYTERWNLKPFRGPVIKVSVLDVLLKWIFYVFHSSPRHFSIVTVYLSVRVCVPVCVWNGPHIMSIKKGSFWLQNSSITPECLRESEPFFYICGRNKQNINQMARSEWFNKYISEYPAYGLLSFLLSLLSLSPLQPPPCILMQPLLFTSASLRRWASLGSQELFEQTAAWHQ